MQSNVSKTSQKNTSHIPKAQLTLMTQNLIAGKKRSQLVTGADDDVSDTLKMLNSVSTS